MQSNASVVSQPTSTDLPPLNRLHNRTVYNPTARQFVFEPAIVCNFATQQNIILYTNGKANTILLRYITLKTFTQMLPETVYKSKQDC